MSQAQNGEEEQQIQEIPQVPMKYFGLLGNQPDIDPKFFIKSFWELAAKYGPIFQLNLHGGKLIIISSYKLILETIDEDNYEKIVDGGKAAARDLVGDGLFTAHNHEEVGLIFTSRSVCLPCDSELGYGAQNIGASFRAHVCTENVR